MYVERLKISQFRNLSDVELCLEGHAPVLLRGANGQGKTNILEALYFCLTGRSFRHAALRELLQHGATRAAVSSEFVRHDVRHEVVVGLADRQRRLQVDGRRLRSSGELLGLVNTVAFFPDDLRIARGSPEDRRRFFDRAVANQHATFFETASRYYRVLRARNALLRGAAAPSAEMLDAYSQQLAPLGAELVRCRTATLEHLGPEAERLFAGMMPHGEQQALGVTLTHGVPGLTDSEDFEAAFAEALREGQRRDIQRRTTTVGPHRSDLVLTLEGQPVRGFASQGQQRAIVLALKLAEVRVLRTLLGTAPVLLLDDVSSELDPERSVLLFDALGRQEAQLWVTTTGAVALPLPIGTQTFDVQRGGVQFLCRRGP